MQMRQTAEFPPCPAKSRPRAALRGMYSARESERVLTCGSGERAMPTARRNLRKGRKRSAGASVAARAEKRRLPCDSERPFRSAHRIRAAFVSATERLVAGRRCSANGHGYPRNVQGADRMPAGPPAMLLRAASSPWDVLNAPSVVSTVLVRVRRGLVSAQDDAHVATGKGLHLLPRSRGRL